MANRCCALFEWICRIVIIIFNRRKTGDRCVYFPERIINRPDPCIYSQFFLMQLNRPVTWENPDVAILLGGVKQYTYDLQVNTQYDVAITVHNTSPEKLANSTQVDVRWIEFGAGGQIRHPIATRVVDVPMWPGVAVTHVPWTTPSTPGHFCIEIKLFHPDDGNPANNLGWNNTLVKAAASRVDASIRIFNRWVDSPHVSSRAFKREEPATPWNLVEITLDSYIFHDAYGREADPDVMDNVVMQEPDTGSEDFSYFVKEGIPGFYFNLGGADPEKLAQAKAAGTTLPSNHSSLFAPDVEPAMETGITAEVAVLRNLLNASAEELRKLTAAQSPSSQ